MKQPKKYIDYIREARERHPEEVAYRLSFKEIKIRLKTVVELPYNYIKK